MLQTLPYFTELLMQTMTDYSDPKYKDLYEHIIEYYNFRYGKFSEIPYPNYNQIKKDN